LLAFKQDSSVFSIFCRFVYFRSSEATYQLKNSVYWKKKKFKHVSFFRFNAPTWTRKVSRKRLNLKKEKTSCKPSTERSFWYDKSKKRWKFYFSDGIYFYFIDGIGPSTHRSQSVRSHAPYTWHKYLLAASLTPPCAVYIYQIE
jgi:hypothetical protein